MLRLRAGWVHPVTAPPIPDGAVLVDDLGLIAAVGPDRAVPRPTGAERLEFPEGALVPGLVNCHTHLELTHLAGQGDATQFPAWIRGLRALKDATTPAAFRRAAEQGVRDCWAAGVTCVADTGSTGAVMEALHALGGRGVVYQEVFGPDRAQCETSMAELTAAVERLRRFASGQLRLGVSPHAPYTVSEPLYRAVADFARRENLPIAVHLAESREETQLIRDGSGPFAEALRARGIAVEARGVSPTQYLGQLDVLPSCLCIHCIQVDRDDVTLLSTQSASIAHCPRSNAAHGHGVAPLAAFRAAGLRVGLGTDSVVSTGDVDLWSDALAAGLAGEDALRMLTLEGARALGMDSEIGSIDVGKQADLAVFTSTALHHPPPSSTALFVTPSSTALFVTVAGRVVHRYIGPP
jgi:cytosine/adenosine deaminase-related metal-dependent hydrolase